MTTTEAPDETLEERIQRGIEDGTIRQLKMTPERSEHAELIEQFKAFKPSHSNWWTRSTLRRLIRITIGLHDDVNKGELFERVVMSNIVQLSNLMQGLRNDLDAATRVQNPVNSKVVDLDERLTFYEFRNDALQPTYRKLMRIRTNEQIKREHETDKQHRTAVKKELKDHAQFGELLDCPDCDLEDPNCKTCNGLGVVPNPDYIPKPKETVDANSVEEGGVYPLDGSIRELKLES